MRMDAGKKGLRLSADFNGLFMSARLLCLSHNETCRDQSGNDVAVREGMSATALTKKWMSEETVTT